MQGEESFEDLEPTRLAVVLVLLALQPPVNDLRQLIQLHEELSEHLLLDGLLVSPHALDFVPELDLQRLPKSFFHQLLIGHIDLDEVRLLDRELLQI